MRIHDIPDFQGVLTGSGSRGGGIIPRSGKGGYVAFAIGPESYIDLVRVDGKLLGLGQVLPCDPTVDPRVDPVRGRPAGDSSPNSITTPNPNNRLQLICYECGDEILPAQPRPPLIQDIKLALTAAASPVRAFRVPFSGRWKAQFTLHSVSPGAAILTYSIEGFRYKPRGRDAADVEGTVESAGKELTSGTFNPGTLPNGSGAAFDAAEFVIVGGVDNAEHFDELMLWVSTDVTTTWDFQVEAWDRGGP